MNRKNLIDDAMELLEEIVAVPSVSFEEAAVCDTLTAFLSIKGIPFLRIGNNIVAKNGRFSPEKKTFMLCAHSDTVPANENYTLDPYRPDYAEVKKLTGLGKGEIVYGLGSNDDGGSVVSLCSAFRYFYDKELPINLMLAISCEEERSGPGGMTLLWKKMRSGELPEPAWAIVGEPTHRRAATSERGLLVVDGEASGVAGHAACHEGVNALYIALDDIATLRAHHFSRISPTMGEVTLNVTQIKAGQAHNIIPDKCRFTIDIRPTEMYDNAQLLSELQSLCKSSLTARNLANKSSATPTDSLLMKCLSYTGIETCSSPTTSDWMRIGCEAIKMGPGDSSRSHKKDEFITRDEISKGVNGYIEFLKNFLSLYNQLEFQ